MSAPTINSPTTVDVRELCRRHDRLTAQALAELAPIASAGHAAHVQLFAAAHAGEWSARAAVPPLFVTRSKPAAELGRDWQQIAAHADDPAVRAELEARRAAGEVATAHLVRLAEPLIRHVVRPLATRVSCQTTVAGLADMLNTGRAAVAQGIWAYDPTRGSGPHYLRAWIEEHVRREMGGLTFQVSVPVRTHQRFIRIAAVRADLAEQLGREPTDTELLARPDAAFTQADLDDERATRHRRTRTGLGLDILTLEDGCPDRERTWPATLDPAERHPDELDAMVAARVDADGPVGAGWRALLEVLQLGPEQVEIVSRYVGLPPFEGMPEPSHSERAIAECLGLARPVVHQVITAVGVQAGLPGGRLHHILAQLSVEDREGLGWASFARALGDLPADTEPPPPVPRILTQPLTSAQEIANSDVHTGLTVGYRCVECGWAGRERYPAERFVLARVQCPECRCPAWRAAGRG